MNEAELFNRVKEYYPDLQKPKDQFSAFDCYSVKENLYIELKCRSSHYDKLLIEKLKFDRLSTIARTWKMTPVYVCSTPKGIWGFNLNKMLITWEERSDLPTTTLFEDKQKITKVVGYLDIKDGLGL